MLEAASKQHGGANDVENELQNEENEKETDGSISALLGRSLFHCMTPAGEDGISDEYEFAGSGQDTVEETEKEIAARVCDAEKEDPSRKTRKTE